MVTKDVLNRSASAVVIAAVVIAGVCISPLTLVLLCGFITAQAMVEFYNLSKFRETVPVLYSIAVGLIILALSFLTGCHILRVEWMLLALPLLFTLFIKEMYRKKESPLENISVSLAGIIYIALPMSLLVNMGLTFNGFAVVYNYAYVLGYIILIWTNDVGAYIVGMSIGKTKLFERLSPKKSWEGFIGGVVFTIIAALLIAHFTGGRYFIWLAIGAVLAVSAVAGDLVESMFKREAKVKDSGSLIPGHGGVLDRFDAMFISIPFVFVIIKFFS